MLSRVIYILKVFGKNYVFQMERHRVPQHTSAACYVESPSAAMVRPALLKTKSNVYLPRKIVQAISRASEF